jgi:hypothetical protein
MDFVRWSCDFVILRVVGLGKVKLLKFQPNIYKKHNTNNVKYIVL